MLEQIIVEPLPKDLKIPEEICELCMEQLKMSFKFQQLYRHTNEQLLRIWEETRTSSTKINNSIQNSNNSIKNVKSEDDGKTGLTVEESRQNQKIDLNSHNPSRECDMMHSERNGYSCLNCNITVAKAHQFFKQNKSQLIEHNFICKICDYRYTTNILLEEHIREAHQPRILLKIIDLKRHWDKTHEEPRERIPNIINENVQVENAEKLWPGNNESDVNDTNGYFISCKPLLSCTECRATFKTANRLKCHKKSHVKCYRFVCHICDRQFKFPRLLKQHLVKVHSQNINNKIDNELADKLTGEKQPQFQCNYCKCAYNSVGSLAQHMSKKHPAIKPFKCDKCDKSFVVEEHFKIHINRHNGIKNFKCEHCDKSFSFKFAMKQHMRMHTEPAPYLCTLCGKTFYRPSNLRQHMQRHGEEKPYACPHCPKRFKCPSDRYIHLMSHNAGKVHVCSTCGSRFSRLDTLNNHQMLHSGKKPYKCDQCSMTFASPVNLNRHKRTHTGEKPYKCQYCDRAYAQSNDLTKHLRTHLGENVYICSKCPEAFKYHAELKKHQLKHYHEEQESQKSANSIDVKFNIQKCSTECGAPL
uniref:C2H2-type domain-containing protein n=1 Tax=Glossina brevipalpis TaxID=37001 RepID=A0A1A9W188_9MUSC